MESSNRNQRERKVNNPLSNHNNSNNYKSYNNNNQNRNQNFHPKSNRNQKRNINYTDDNNINYNNNKYNKFNNSYTFKYYNNELDYQYDDYQNYSHNKKYNRRNDNFNENKHRNQMEKKREFNKKKWNEEKEKREEEQKKLDNKNEEKKMNIDPNYNKEEIRIKGKLLDIELKREEEDNKEENDKARDEINKYIGENYENQLENINQITKKEKKTEYEKNIFHKIVLESPKLKSNPYLVSNLLNLLKEYSNENLESQIIDLLGFEEIETVSQIIQNKTEIKELIQIAVASLDEKNDILKQQENLIKYGIERIDKKHKKKKLTEMQKIQEENYKILQQLGFSKIFLNKFYQFEEDNEEYDELEKKELHPVIELFGEQVTENIKRDKELFETNIIDYKEYRKVEVKPILKERKKIELISVKEKLPEWIHKCFNFNFFNEIQSTVFNKAFLSDENLLISAPTGAGKTNIALLTILREINKELRMKNYIDINKDFDFNNIIWDFKILFLVPLKALANEIVDKFNNQLKFLNIVINEFSGDVNLTREQIEKTNLFIGIPEKWDLFTRKHDDIFNYLKLMIIDEVHLLNEDRGRVLECIVARTIRKSEINQKFVRLVGLSATLPNYYDIADFLRVKEGLFNFDTSYRVTPLEMNFFGLNDILKDEDYKKLENQITYNQIIECLKNNKQVLVFVHSRMETITFAEEILKLAEENNELGFFKTNQEEYKKFSKLKISNKKINELIPYSIGFHNAGILRKDRNAIELLFKEKILKLLVSTSTLAWGVNLPAYACIIKGTKYYDASSSKFVDIGILDIQQMFGRAGRPQYDKKGIGIIISPLKKIEHYIALLKDQLPIKSSLDRFLPDSLNAEIAIGNISSLNDAINWLQLTYYGRIITGKNRDKNLDVLRSRIKNAFVVLNEVKLIRYFKNSHQVHTTELGRIACNYYMNYKSIDKFNKSLVEDMTERSFIEVFSKCDEFANMKIYEDEKSQLNELAENYEIISKNAIKEDIIDDKKAIILLYTYLHGDYQFSTSSLFMDSAYIVDNSPRILRAMIEVCLHKHLIRTTFLCMNYMKYVERRVAPRKTPLWQMTYFSVSAKLSKKSKFKVYNNNYNRDGYLNTNICNKLDNLGKTEINDILKEDKFILSKELNISIQNALELIKYARKIPQFYMKIETKPLTRTILNITITLTPKFLWSKKFSHQSEPFWIIVNNEKEIIHYEQFILLPKQNEKINTRETVLTFAVPFDIQPGKRKAHLESVYTISIISERWIGSEISESFYLADIEVPDDQDVKTELLNIYPLPLNVLQDKDYEKVFSDSFKFFNPIQTQIFYSVYHTDENLLVGAPTGSGKTVIAELAMLRLFKKNPTGKIIYIAPLKSLAKERVTDWKNKFQFINKNVLELTGDFTPDLDLLLKADILITTPEKWDGISRNWHHRAYVKKVSIVIIDEIHLLGLERGPVIEVIVSRMRFISHKMKSNVRFIGLSTALANSVDVAEWLGISVKYDNRRAPGLFNFKPAVRPCPVTVHIEGFPEKRYCPRMATMNKPCYNAIINFSDNKPVLLFVSSRRQTRLTALDLIALSANSSLDNQNTFLNVPIKDIENDIDCIYDENLRHTLTFGIGMHHAGLIESDRKIVERLFLNQKIQILIATSTLAWGVNFPAHLVIIKGTEYYHPKLCTYIDMPITDILQMIGRAGRPQFDNEAVACLFVKQDKKNFYKKFLYEPFPLESSLHKMLFDHINAEISSGMLSTKTLCIEYIKWTYFFKRLVKNPTFYGLTSSADAKTLNNYLNNILNNVLTELHKSNCIEIHDNDKINSTPLGNLTSFYYMSYKSAKFYYDNLNKNLSIIQLMDLLSKATEFEGVPVRHNEEGINEQLSNELPIKLSNFNFGSSHTKTFLLIQAHFSRIPMPISDYKTDLKTILDNCIRILLFMADISFEKKYLDTTLNILTLIQMIMQGVWENDCSLKSLPNLEIKEIRNIINKGNISHICELCEMYHSGKDIKKFLEDECKINTSKNDEMENLIQILSKLPILDVSYKLYSLDSTLKRVYDSPIIENGDCQILINLKKINDIKNNLIIYSRYGKIKSCRWFIVIGNIKTNEILVFEKVSFKEKVFKNISFIAPKEIDNDSLVLYLISDSYFGLDQQYNIRLKDINKGIMDKFGIIKVQNNKNESDNNEKNDSNNHEYSEDEVETKKDENEDEEDIYLENW